MYKTMHNLAPTYLSELFHYTNEIHNRVIGSTHDNNIYVHKPNIELFRTSFCYCDSKIWNAMPDSIKHASSVQQFKYKYLVSGIMTRFFLLSLMHSWMMICPVLLYLYVYVYNWRKDLREDRINPAEQFAIN